MTIKLDTWLKIIESKDHDTFYFKSETKIMEDRG